MIGQAPQQNRNGNGQAPMGLDQPQMLPTVPPSPAGSPQAGVFGATTQPNDPGIFQLRGRKLAVALMKKAQAALNAKVKFPAPKLNPSEVKDGIPSTSVPGGYNADDIDTEGFDQEPGDREKAKVREIGRMFQSSAIRRQKQARFWEYCRRYKEGDQFLVTGEHGEMLDGRTEDEEAFSNFHIINYIDPIVRKVASLATQNDPDCTPVPRTSAQLDKDASAEARGVIGQCNRVANNKSFMYDMASDACVTTSHYAKVVWDSKAEALLPIYDPQTNEMIGSFVSPVGEVMREHVPGSELYWDPSAKDEKSAQWCIHATIKPLSWVQDTFGPIADTIKATNYVDGGETSSDPWDELLGPSSLFGAVALATATVIDGLVGNRTSKHRPNAALVLELWRKPGSRLFPDGQRVIAVGNRIVFDGVWPYDKKDEFPFVPVTFQKSEDSPYGFNLVGQLIDAQATINKEWSRILSRLDREKRTIMIERLSNIGADSLEEHRDLAKVYFDRGSRVPTFIQAPPIAEAHFQMIDRAYKALQDISGMADVLKGDVPAGATSGIMIELLTENAVTLLRPFLNSIADASVRIAEWEIALYAQFASEERLVELDDTGSLVAKTGAQQFENGFAKACAFTALADGGQTRVICSPDSGMPRSVAGENQQVFEMYKMQLFGLPGDPKAGAIVADLLTYAGSTRMQDYFAQRITEQQGVNAQIAQMQQELTTALQQNQALQLTVKQLQDGTQAQAAASTQNQQIALQIEQTKQQMQTQRELALIAAKSQADQETATTVAGLKAQTDAHQQGAGVYADTLKSILMPKTAASTGGTSS